MLLKAKQFAELLEVTQQRISGAKKQGHVVATADNHYDTSDPVNRAFMRDHFHREFLRQSTSDDQPQSIDAEKTRQEIRYIEARRIKVELQNAELKRSLIPIELATQAWGAWGNAIRNNVLTLGKRIARTDLKLQEKIERHTKKAVDKAKDQAAAEIRRMVEHFVPADTDEESENGSP